MCISSQSQHGMAPTLSSTLLITGLVLVCIQMAAGCIGADVARDQYANRQQALGESDISAPLPIQPGEALSDLGTIRMRQYLIDLGLAPSDADDIISQAYDF